MTTIRLGQLVAETAGEGPAVILVHGLGGTSNTFQPLMGALSGHRVVRPDLPGSGRSPVPHAAPSIESYVEALVGMAKALGVSQAHFVGHSLGTIVIYARTAAREYLFIGDIAWVMSSIEHLRGRPRLINFILPGVDPDRPAVLRQIRALHDLAAAEPDLVIANRL